MTHSYSQGLIILLRVSNSIRKLYNDMVLHFMEIENEESNLFVWQWYVYQLIQTSRPKDGGINDIGTVGSSNDKDVLFSAHPVHFSE